MLELAMHVLDIVQNSLRAGATRVEIQVREDLAKDLWVLEIEDNGRGISKEMLSRVGDPFVTSRLDSGGGLGIPLLKQAAESCGGGLEIQSQEGQGTKVAAYFQLNHLDRPPLGDMGETMGVLIGGNPTTEFFYEHKVNGKIYFLDTVTMKKILGVVSIDGPAVVAFIKKDVETGLKEIGADRFAKIRKVLE
jgi:hypothetical protein